MKPSLPSAPTGSRRPCRRAPPRLRAALCGAALLLGAGMAEAAPDLRQLDTAVRRGQADALAQLAQAADVYGARAPYASQVAYLRLQAQAQVDAGDLDAAAATDGRIVRLAAAHGDTVNAARAALGQVNRMTGKDPAAALAELGKLDAHYARVADPEFVATVQRLYGDAYVALGQFDFGLGHYLKALEIARAHPELLAPRVAGVQLSIARAYTYAHEADKVLASIPPAGQEGGGLPPRARARVFLYKGIAEVLLGHPARAREAYEEGIAVARTHGLTVVQADILANISDSWLVEHRYPDAERAAREALDLARRSGDPDAIRVASANLGFALMGQGRVDEGRKVIDGVLAHLREAHSWPDLADLLAEESRALERAGRTAEALAVLREHEAIVGRLESSESEKTVAVMQGQFSAQQHAIQIEALRRENAVKDREIQQRRVWQLIASSGAALALLLCGFVYRLYRRSQRTQRQLELLNSELAFHSTHDALTGLLNRRSFRERMQADAGSAGAPLEALPAACYVLLDIDHFKSINDRYGHAAGDDVLVEVARRLRETVGERGLVMRWGGEEFLVYVESLEPAAHAGLVRSLLDTLAASPVALAIESEGGQALDVTLTAGALSLPARPAGDAIEGRPGRPEWQQALALADHALYKGKQDGRNRAYLIDGAATGAGAGAGAPRPELVLPGPHARPVLRDAAA